jgi:tetratricopeptide (TPR) repeat protein
MRQGRWQEALSKLEEAVRIDPLNPQRYIIPAKCYSLMRDYKSADRYIDRALVLDPSHTEASFFRVRLNLFEHGSIDGGEKSFNSIAKNAGLARISTWNTLGFWRFIVDRIDSKEAITTVRNVAHERSPHVMYMHIAQIYDLTGKHDSAQIFYDSSRIILNRMISRGDAEFDVYTEIGVIYALMGRSDEAIAAGTKAKEVMSVDDCHW